MSDLEKRMSALSGGNAVNILSAQASSSLAPSSGTPRAQQSAPGLQFKPHLN